MLSKANIERCACGFLGVWLFVRDSVLRRLPGVFTAPDRSLQPTTSVELYGVFCSGCDCSGADLVDSSRGERMSPSLNLCNECGVKQH